MAQIVVLKRAHFFSLDNDIIDVHAPTIGALGVAIYATLARYANRSTGECWPAIGRIARTLQLARSTVKVYLRKLEEVGLITITERQDAAGDPSSNRYTLLDPSPLAVDTRRAARATSAAPVPEGGRPPGNPPPVASQPTGGAAATPEPSSPEPNATNQAGRCSSAQGEGTKDQARTCKHPLEERLRFGEVAVCPHCWARFEELSGPEDVGADCTEGMEVPSTPCAA